MTERTDRLYQVTYKDPEDEESYEGIFPEWALAEIEEIEDATFIGYLGVGMVIGKEPESTDPGGRKVTPIKKKA